MKKIWILIIVLLLAGTICLLAIFDVGRNAETGQNWSSDYNSHNYLFRTDSVKISEPLPDILLADQIRISGFARGNWFFEASFPIELRDGSDKVVGQTIATAKTDWMTTEFVPFEASLTLPKHLLGRGAIVFKKDNPSGLPEFDDYVTLPVLFSTSTPAVIIDEPATTTPE
ncbi:MAG: Gmad2 immunoglobulin-like domain-containing protein [Candidatus Paceibacterota bacterium]|jgi:hypothetical protein